MKIRPTIKDKLAYYVEQLTKTGLYGRTASEVVVGLVEQGVRQAVIDGHIQIWRTPGEHHEARDGRATADAASEPGKDSRLDF